MNVMDGAQCHFCKNSFPRKKKNRKLAFNEHLIVPAYVGGPKMGWNTVRVCHTCYLRQLYQWPSCKCDKCTEALGLYQKMLINRSPGVSLENVHKQFDTIFSEKRKVQEQLALSKISPSTLDHSTCRVVGCGWTASAGDHQIELTYQHHRDTGHQVEVVNDRLWYLYPEPSPKLKFKIPQESSKETSVALLLYGEGEEMNVSMSPEVAVERHAAMVAKLKDHGLHRLFMAGMQPMIRLSNVVTREKMEDFVASAFAAFSNGLVLGDTVLISPSALQLIQYAAASLDPASEFDLSVVPMKNATAWFADPVEFAGATNSKGENVRGWCDGFILDCADMADGNPIHSYFFIIRYEEDPQYGIRLIAPLFVSEGMSVGVGSSEDEYVQSVERENPLLVGRRGEFVAFNPKPLLMALWSLIAQPIISSSVARPITPAARKARKKLASKGNVRILSLRQRVAPEGKGHGSGGTRTYTHQWIVRGFWRNQRYGPKRSQIKRIWIDAYVKGPADAPLSLTPRVYVARGEKE